MFRNIFLGFFLAASVTSVHAQPTIDQTIDYIENGFGNLDQVSNRIKEFEVDVDLEGCNLRISSRSVGVYKSRDNQYKIWYGSSLGKQSNYVSINVDVLVDESRKLGSDELLNYQIFSPKDEIWGTHMLVKYSCSSCVKSSWSWKSSGVNDGGSINILNADTIDRYRNDTNQNWFQTPLVEAKLLSAEYEEGMKILGRFGEALKYLVESAAKQCGPNTKPDDPLDDFFQSGSVAPSQPAPKATATTTQTVNLLRPETWLGKTINGRLVSSGKPWYAWLRTNGTTTFQYSSGIRKNGRYYISEGRVCFKLDDWAEYDCRTPVSRGGKVLWLNSKGEHSSEIFAVNNVSMATVKPAERAISASVRRNIGTNQCAVIVSSKRTIGEARSYIIKNVSNRRLARVYKTLNGWLAVSVATINQAQADDTLASWKSSGRIPSDSFCAEAEKVTDVVAWQ